MDDRRRERKDAQGIARLDRAILQERRMEARPFSWWVAQADAMMERCVKCEGPVEGVYVPPTQATMGECAVVAHCRICGAERMVLAGRGGVPYTDQASGQLRGPREKARRMNTSRRGDYGEAH